MTKQKKKTTKKKPLVNIMRKGRNRAPFMDTYAGKTQGFGHSRGK